MFLLTPMTNEFIYCITMYNDDTTECKTPFELDHYMYKRQVVFLLYAEMSYYNGTMECGADF